MVEVISVNVVRFNVMRMFPINIVHLYLDEIPMIFVMVVDEPFKHSRVAMERESEVADAA